MHSRNRPDQPSQLKRSAMAHISHQTVDGMCPVLAILPEINLATGHV
jgi:hypothetical protein